MSTSPFVFQDPATPANPPAPIADEIVADGFWPALKISDARGSLRMLTDVTDLRLKDAIVGGMITVIGELATWRAARAAEGKGSLIAIDPTTLAGKLRLEILWMRAVFAFAGADLAENHHDISATGDGRARTVEERIPAADELRRTGTHAIRDILAVGRTAVELI